MQNSYVAFADPLLQEGVPRSARCKALALLSLVLGLSCAVLWSSGAGQYLAVQKPITTMALPYTQPVNALQSVWPANLPRPLAGYEASFRGVSPVRAVQDKLSTYGIGSSPLAEFALKSIDVNNRLNRRDISVKAAQSEIATGWDLEDKKTKEKLVKVINQVEAKESLLAGISAPMGFFDPLGFATTVTGGKLLFYREVELKHGRVAMLAALGMLVGEKFHPLFGGDIDVPAYLAFQQTPLQNFWPAVVAAIAIPEVYSVLTFQDPSKGEEWAMKLDHVPGDLGFDPLGLKPTDPKEFREMQTKEINNGRLAMIAAAGMIAQELATGEKLF